ncbi:hypothetical protein ACFOY2_05430 [Nonomuraea purpurea]|uniref:Uncharacterized protein n=1 Tax=Nonomuraea purpurea TaxID=1849276 RepID=A0ABV8G1X0_9ACTN
MAASVRAVTSASSATPSYTCDRPTVVASDLMLAFQVADLGTLADMSTPTGGTTWQLLAQRSWNGIAGGKVWWKVAGASEPSTYGFAQEGTADGVVIVASVSGARTTTPVVAQTGTDGNSLTVPTPGITPTGADDLELRCAIGQGPEAAVTFTQPAGYTLHTQVQSGLYPAEALASKALTSGAPTGVLNFTVVPDVWDPIGFTVAVASAIYVAPPPRLFSQAVQRAAYY